MVSAYPDYSKVFEIYTDASRKQLIAVITQDSKPIAFFSQKLTVTLCIYSVIKIELLALVETLKEFKGMLWGQPIKVFTDHKNLMRDALGSTSDLGLPIEVTARGVWAQDCLYQRHTQNHCRCNLTA